MVIISKLFIAKSDPRGTKQVDEADTWELWRQDGACLKWGPVPAYCYARIWVHSVKIFQFRSEGKRAVKKGRRMLV